MTRLGASLTALLLCGCATTASPVPPLAADAAGRVPVSVGSGVSGATLSGVLAFPKRPAAVPP